MFELQYSHNARDQILLNATTDRRKPLFNRVFNSCSFTNTQTREKSDEH